MAEAKLDQNYKPTIIGVSSVDLATPVNVAVNPVTGAVKTDISATIEVTGIATDANQTNGSQKSQIVDGAGNVIGATSNALDVNIKSGSSAGVQYTEGDTDATITGTVVMWEDGANTLVAASAAKPLPVTASLDTTGLATSAKQDTIIGHVDGVETLIGTTNTTLGTIDTDTSNISTKIDTIAGAVAGTEVQVDVLTMPTTTVQATNLDIRDLANTSDSVAIYGSDDGGTTKRIIKTDAGGAIQIDLEVASVTANAGTNLNTSALALETGGNLASIKTNTDKIPALGQALAAASVPVILPAATITTLTPPAAITGFSTETTLAAINTKLASGTVIGDVNLGATDNAVLDTIAAKDFATQTTLAAMNAKMVTGTDIGDVTINNSTGAAAVNIQDGGNTITVDGTVAVTSAGITTIAGAIAGTEMQVDVLTMPTVTVNAHAVTNAGTFATQVDGAALTALQIMDDWDNTASDGASVSGDVAHDGVDAGEPVKIGHKAIAHGTNPTAVAAGDRTDSYANRAGIPFVVGGHPNIVTKNFNVADADGAQTDADILGAIGAGTKYVVTMLQVFADQATTAATQCRIGFGTANTPALDAAGVLLSHGGIAPGSGVVVGNGGGIIGIGADGAELRVTCEDPAGGSLDITVTYYTIES